MQQSPFWEAKNTLKSPKERDPRKTKA